MHESEYDGSSTESETYESDYESVAVPFKDVKTESINILALGDALASQYPPSSALAAPTPVVLPASSSVSNSHHEAAAMASPVTLNAPVKSASHVHKPELSVLSQDVSQPSSIEAMPVPAQAAPSTDEASTGHDDTGARPHPACAGCGNLLLLIGDGGADIAPEDRAQCSCGKQTFPCKLYSKTQLGKQGNRRCLACVGNQKKCREMEAAGSNSPLACRACLKSLPPAEFSKTQRANEATRRCKTCIQNHVHGNVKRPFDAKKAAQKMEKQNMFEHQVAKIKMAWRALERKKAANDLRGSSRVAYEEQLEREEKELRSRQSQLRNRDKHAFDEVIARLQIKDAVGLGNESDKNIAKKNIAKNQKKAKPLSTASKGSTVPSNDAEKAPKLKASIKRSASKAGLKETSVPAEKPRVKKDQAKISQSSAVESGKAAPTATRTKQVPANDSTSIAPRRNPPRGRAQPNEITDLTDD